MAEQHLPIVKSCFWTVGIFSPSGCFFIEIKTYLLLPVVRYEMESKFF